MLIRCWLSLPTIACGPHAPLERRALDCRVAPALVPQGAQVTGKRLDQYATEIKVRTERRCGELLRDTAARGERACAAANLKQAPKSDGATSAPTLSDMGLTRDESSRYQQLAAMPSEHFFQRCEQVHSIAGRTMRRATN